MKEGRPSKGLGDKGGETYIPSQNEKLQFICPFRYICLFVRLLSHILMPTHLSKSLINIFERFWDTMMISMKY